MNSPFKHYEQKERSLVVVVYQCSIRNVMVTGDIEAVLYSKVHAVFECYKNTRYFIEPLQSFPHTGLDYA